MVKRVLKFELDDATDKHMRWVVQHLPTPPRGPVRAMRIALHLLETALQAEERGATLFVRESDGSEHELSIG